MSEENKEYRENKVDEKPEFEKKILSELQTIKGALWFIGCCFPCLIPLVAWLLLILFLGW